MVGTRLRGNSNNLELHEAGNACWILRKTRESITTENIVRGTARSLIKSVTSCHEHLILKQSLNISCLGKYLSVSFETLKAKTTRHYAKNL